MTRPSPTANAQDVTAKTLTRSPEMLAAYNTSVRDGTQTEDPRQDFNHPLHDIVCGWCGEIHTAVAPAVPDDMVLVPRVPTDAMKNAAYDNSFASRPIATTWAAMCAAAPADTIDSVRAALHAIAVLVNRGEIVGETPAAVAALGNADAALAKVTAA